jgi:hypothetical protein
MFLPLAVFERGYTDRLFKAFEKGGVIFIANTVSNGGYGKFGTFEQNLGVIYSYTNDIIFNTHTYFVFENAVKVLTVNAEFIGNIRYLN